jgi:hypothetical protein
MSPKVLMRIGGATFAGLLLMAALYYKERATFLDISFHLFSILKDKGFAIQNNRFAAFFTQLFPLLGSRMGLSLAAIAMGYTLSFIFLQILVFGVLLLRLKNVRVALAYLLYLLLMTTHGFYWIQSEMPQGAAFLFLFIGLLENALQKESMPPHFLFYAPVLLFTIGFAHPLLLFPFVFVMLFLREHHPGKRKAITSLLLAGVVVFLAKSIFMSNYYDDEKMSAAENLSRFFPDYFTLKANAQLLHHFLHHYYFLPIGFAGALYFYGKTKQWLKAFLMAAFFLGYIFVVNITNPEGGDQFYFENFYLNLALILALPLAFDVLPAIANRKLQAGIVLLVCTLGLLRIWQTHRPYTARLQWERGILDEAARSPQHKWVLSTTAWPRDTLVQCWGSPYEFWLLSTIERDTSASIIIEQTAGEFDGATPTRNAFIARWGVFEYNTLNPRYFKYRDTTAYIKPR